MVYITQLIYIYPGREGVFERFESIVLPLLAKYNGRLLLRVRPDQDSFVHADVEKPYEIHLIEFHRDTDFQQYLEDTERKHALHLKEAAVRVSVSYTGARI